MALSAFVPEIWSTEVLARLLKEHVFASLANRDYQGLIANLGDTVRISGLGDVTISDYSKDTALAAAETITDAQTTLQITQAKSFRFQIDDVDQRNANVKDIMEQHGMYAAYKLADAVDTYVAGFYTDASAANLIGSSGSSVTPDLPTYDKVGGGTTIYDYIVQADQLLTQSLIPRAGRWMVVPPSCKTLLANDPRFTSFNTAAAVAALAAGLNTGSAFLGRVANFDVYESVNVHHISGTFGTTGSLDVYHFGHPMGLSFAENLAKVEPYRHPDYFADAVKGLHLYGAKTIRPAALGAMYITQP